MRYWLPLVMAIAFLSALFAVSPADAACPCPGCACAVGGPCDCGCECERSHYVASPEYLQVPAYTPLVQVGPLSFGVHAWPVAPPVYYGPAFFRPGPVTSWEYKHKCYRDGRYKAKWKVRRRYY